MSDKQLVNPSRKQFMWTGGEGLTPGCMKGLGGGLMKLWNALASNPQKWKFEEKKNYEEILAKFSKNISTKKKKNEVEEKLAREDHLLLITKERNIKIVPTVF